MYIHLNFTSPWLEEKSEFSYKTKVSVIQKVYFHQNLTGSLFLEFIEMLESEPYTRATLTHLLA